MYVRTLKVRNVILKYRAYGTVTDKKIQSELKQHSKSTRGKSPGVQIINATFQIIISPISISRADDMNRVFIQKSMLLTNCSNEANNDSDHNIIIIIITFCWMGRSHMMTTEK